ncbi:MAG: cellulase family glycosylhydrolase [Sphingobacteriaceae bacterium]|nr:cellulase family glycosylhydrolase [Sphingobacteriaceae bacterium]
MKSLRILILFSCLVTSLPAGAQKVAPTDKNGIYVDKSGVLRWESSNKEAAFFGVNYTAPFAYAFRAHKVLNADLENAIKQDVYHIARLGFDAFRVHVWDTEITDSVGNILNNDHLRLFDFLIAELKKRNIKTFITPIAFWGNGYPERDEKTAGFSSIYNKGKVLVTEKAIIAQERYLDQFFKHVNPYTGLTYCDDPDIIAAEINNEPSHSGPKQAVTEYINRLNKAIRNTGYTKPIFYNISQTPYYADAVAKSDVNGFTFQWYPVGLVANREIKGNFLPHVDQYAIPYDTIPAYKNKPKMVYEFDAADIMQSNIYPAIARSFRKAGFQWATQFAYDPMAIAYANTEYQTHYMNLAYTPSKAISLMIASKAFHKLPRLKNYGTYPADSIFDVFRVSHKESLSEMNSAEEFYYSNSTRTKPVNVKVLKKIAGVGSSPIVTYKGYGAYFLDKLEDGIWRLEVMPDAILIRDPFEKASLKKEVTRIQFENQAIQIILPDLGNSFAIKALNSGNDFTSTANAAQFNVFPGTYLLSRKGKSAGKWTADKLVGALGLNEFVAPKPLSAEVFLSHQPFAEITAGESLKIHAILVGVDAGTKVTLYANNLASQYKTIQMIRESAYDYTAEIPAEIITPGMLNYLIVVQQGNDYSVFPGNHKGNPFAWDNYINENWHTYVAAQNNVLEIFNPNTDRNVRAYPSTWGGDVKASYTSASKPQQLIWSISAGKLPKEQVMGMQHFFADKVKGSANELASFNKIVIRARSIAGAATARIALINKDAASYETNVSLSNEFQDIELPLSQFKPGAFLLLPRPYPDFMPLWYRYDTRSPLKINEIERLEVTIGSGVISSLINKPYNLQIESIWLKK